MKFGICTDIDNLKLLEEIGYDYFETNITHLASLSKSELEDYKSKIADSPIKLEACNILFPWDIHLIGNEIDIAPIQTHLDKVYSTANFLGVDTIVFGSGGARRVPDCISDAEGYSQLIRMSRLIADMAANYGITIALEPLNRDETNIINSVSEGNILVNELNHPNMRLLADSYHMFKEDEPISRSLQECASNLCHVHVALKEGRTFPTVADAQIKEFMEGLKAMNYQGRVSIEGSSEAFKEDAIASLKVLRDI